MTKENLYNKAAKYGRNDLCYIIANRDRMDLKVLRDFKKNVNLYEETGEQRYKDKCTGRYNHRIMWQAIIDYIREGRDLSIGLVAIKKKVIKENRLPTPWKCLCYACITHCTTCPINKATGICYKNGSAFSLLCETVRKNNKEEAVKYAKVILEAWDEL